MVDGEGFLTSTAAFLSPFANFHSPSHLYPPSMITAPELTTTTEQPAATIHLVIPGRDMPKHMDPAIQEILKVLADQGLQPAGPMFSYHHRRPSDTFDLEIGFPVAQAIDEQGRVKSGSLPAEQVARCIYQGP
jgi:effector-binding domain-containing protein